jgi:ATP-binding cassette, subfamily B, bacterial PglK
LKLRDSLGKLRYIFDRPDKINFSLLFILMGLASLLEVIGIGAIPVYIAIVTNPDSIRNIPVIQSFSEQIKLLSSEQLLLWGSVILIGIFLIKNAYLGFYHYLKTRIVYNLQIKLGNRMFSAYLDAPYVYHLNRNSAEIQRNINIELRLLFGSVLLPSFRMILDVVTVCLIFTLLLFVQPYITIGTMGILGAASIAFLMIVRKKIKAYGKDAQIQRGEMVKAVNQGIGAIKDVRVLGREQYFKDVYSRSIFKYAQSMRYSQITSQLPQPFIESVAVIIMLLITSTLLLQGQSMETVIPLLTLFAMASIRIMPAVKGIVSGYTNIRHSVYAIDPIYQDLTDINRMRQSSAPIHGQRHYTFHIKRSIDLNGIYFRYPGSERDVIEDLTITIPHGSTVGLFGLTGAGKTTLVDIILGLLDPYKGKVSADGVDVRTNIQAWQRLVGYIPQTIYLTDDTIRRNIAFGIPDDEIDEERITEVAEAAQLHGMLSLRKDDLNTVIGERGVRLSGGQRQRIGIARALYRNPKVLIMDEATSALDNETELQVLEAIKQSRNDLTIIMIAHRLTSVRFCDKIFIMDRGKVVREVTFRELLELSSAYHELAV